MTIKVAGCILKLWLQQEISFYYISLFPILDFNYEYWQFMQHNKVISKAFSNAEGEYNLIE